jgi:hypothetical protein
MIANVSSSIAIAASTRRTSRIFEFIGNVLLRFLLVEAAQVTVRGLPEWRGRFFHLAMRRGRLTDSSRVVTAPPPIGLSFDRRRDSPVHYGYQASRTSIPESVR